MLIVKITPAWFDTCSVFLILIIFWWLCRLCASVKTLCDLDACSCSHVGRIECTCASPRQQLEISRDSANRLPEFTSSLRITNCDSLHIKSKSLEALKGLTRVHLANIRNLALEEHSFSWNDSAIYETYVTAGIAIRVENSTVSTLPTYVFRGRIDEIAFSSVRFEVVRSYAFTSLAGTKVILFTDCHFAQVENQAFKKFAVDDVFHIVDSHFTSTLPSRAVMDVTVRNEFKIKGVAFERIRSAAFKIRGPEKFRLQNCYVRHMEGEAFVVHTRGPVFVDDNVFRTMETGALVGFHVEKHELDLTGHQEFVFKNNTIAETRHASLLFNVNGFAPQLDWIYLNTRCDCRSLPAWLSELIVYSHRYPQEKLAPNLKLDEILSCREPLDGGAYLRLKDYSREYCGERAHPLQTAALASVIAALLLLALLLGCWLWSRRQRRGSCGGRWIGVPTSSPAHDATGGRRQPNGDAVDQQHPPPSPCYEEPSTSRREAAAAAAAADSRRRKDTELHVIVECAEPALYANPFRERTQIYSNRCVELGREYANHRIRHPGHRHQLLTSDL